jgi:hypothetical protein
LIRIKDVDITISRNREPVFCLGIKFVTSHYKQNTNNYFENMMGGTANIQATQIPYAQLIIENFEIVQQNRKMPAPNERFGAMAAVSRRQFCGKWNVITPQQVQWKPPLPQYAKR